MRNFKIYISVIILLFINFLFFFKYSSRYLEFGIYISIILLLLQFFVFQIKQRIDLSKKIQKNLGYSFIGFIIVLVVVSHFAVPLESLKVDRWSVISSFLQELSDGNYPYFAKSHRGNYPGPMPIYFLIASPFYYLGELSILSILGYLFVCVFLIKNIKKNKNTEFLFFYLFTSAFLIWEILTRSNLFTFTILIIVVLNEFINISSKKSLRFYSLAFLAGLLLSTRSIYVLPYIVFFLSSLIKREITFKELFLFGLIAVTAFISTFIPFIHFFNDDFFVMNPFIIQSSFLIPKFYIIIFIIITLFLTFLVKNKADRFFYSGISLFTAISIYAFYQLIHSGYKESFINGVIDISYFIFCVPFLIKYLLDVDHKIVFSKNLQLPKN